MHKTPALYIKICKRQKIENPSSVDSTVYYSCDILLSMICASVVI